ncbi:MAG TPA: bifunctional folylpolyglutamate synthase/dihydrofolate synthase, partial [Verrucomicrobiales bacterium]|nr:bifunctional folylpolyglutamate synthase/dihydrofolate synthase [Verrucomicrobiales bacterium]
MNFPQAIDFLYRLQLFGAVFGLENTRRLAALAGNPQNRLRFVHVAGTNGKGSVCAMLESVYRSAGLRTGLYTSPHLIHFGERIQINGRRLPETDVIRLVGRMQELLAEGALRGWWDDVFNIEDRAAGAPLPTHPTFFEVVTVMALIHFAETDCEIVLWETGLGGRLDATNIVTPLASVITNTTVEHAQQLGDTVTKIAAEKSGIIKPGVPVVTGVAAGPALQVIREVAASRG